MAPDLAIEILSPSTAANDRGRKMQLLARHGVNEYWLVSPDSVAIDVYARTGDRFALAATATGSEHVQSRLLAGLSLTPAQIVPNPTL